MDVLEAVWSDAYVQRNHQLTELVRVIIEGEQSRLTEISVMKLS